MRLLCLCLVTVAVVANPPRKMSLAFSDDFDGAVIDAKKWAPATYAPPGTIALKSGKLILGIAKDDKGAWKGGLVTTRGRFDQSQGYFEASIRAGKFAGHHLGFVLAPRDKKEIYSEIYVAEIFGEDRIVTWVRYNDGSSLKDEKPSPLPKPFTTPGSSSKDFHTYGVYWTAREYTWYIDGKEVFSTKKGLTQDPATVTLVHTVSEFELPKLDPSKLPDGVEFDWVKVWR